MSPIWIAVVRRAQCTICAGTFDLAEAEEPPIRCPICNTADWMWGHGEYESRLIRQGIARMRKSLNPGAKSKKRQDRAKKQKQGFGTQGGKDVLA